MPRSKADTARCAQTSKCARARVVYVPVMSVNYINIILLLLFLLLLLVLVFLLLLLLVVIVTTTSHAPTAPPRAFQTWSRRRTHTSDSPMGTLQGCGTGAGAAYAAEAAAADVAAGAAGAAGAAAAAVMAVVAAAAAAAAVAGLSPLLLPPPWPWLVGSDYDRLVVVLVSPAQLPLVLQLPQLVSRVAGCQRRHGHAAHLLAQLLPLQLQLLLRHGDWQETLPPSSLAPLRPRPRPRPAQVPPPDGRAARSLLVLAPSGLLLLLLPLALFVEAFAATAAAAAAAADAAVVTLGAVVRVVVVVLFVLFLELFPRDGQLHDLEGIELRVHEAGNGGVGDQVLHLGLGENVLRLDAHLFARVPQTKRTRNKRKERNDTQNRAARGKSTQNTSAADNNNSA